MEEEIWKTIQDFPNYEVSSFGNVRHKTTNKLRLLTAHYDKYICINLSNNTIIKGNLVHRLVAKAFIDNPENKPTVNHIDRNKSNNHVSNLEWATMSEQNFHSASIASKERPLFHKAINRIDLTTNTVLQEYKSISDAAKWVIDNKLSTITEATPNNISIISSKMCAVANNKRNNAYNFKWIYKETNTYIENENWKEIPFQIIGKPKYFVSNLGRYKNNKGEIKTNYIPSTGYIRIRIGNTKYLLHRLIALTFLENLENKEIVNHIDGNKLNNNLDNLEWTSYSENSIHAVKNGLLNNSKKIIQYDRNMNKINEFNSMVECSRMLNIGLSCISHQCHGRTKKSTKCGFIFRYANDPSNPAF